MKLQEHDMTSNIVGERSAETLLAAIGRLGRHLPVLGGAIGVVALSMASLSLVEHVVRELLGNGGDVNALVAQHLETLTVVSVKATALGEQIVAYVGIR
jgi:hypothetical protein